MSARWGLLALLVLLGSGWGLTIPLAKVAVSEGYRHFGLIFWQLAVGVVVLGTVSVLRGKGIPLRAGDLRLYTVIALVGTVLPNSASFQAAVHLPAGVISILISMVPMFAFPIALLLATDRFSWTRLAGLLFGIAGVVLLVGPEASLPERAMIAWIPVALIAPAFYGLEGNIVAKWGTRGLDPVQVLFGASLIGMVIAMPLALLSGQWIDPRPPWGLPDGALVLSAVVHAMVYSGYVWIVGRAGAVFASQVSYLVTGSGVIWAMILLGESYTGWIWLALAMMLTGLFLVQPRTKGRLAPGEAPGNT